MRGRYWLVNAEVPLPWRSISFWTFYWWSRHASDRIATGYLAEALQKEFQRVDNSIYWINHYSRDNPTGFGSSYPMDKLPTTGTGSKITQFRSVLLPPDSIRCKAKSTNHINVKIVQWNRRSVLKRIKCILYLNTTGFKAQSFWGRVQIKFNQMQVFKERRKPEYPGKNLSEQRREPSNLTFIWRRI